MTGRALLAAGLSVVAALWVAVSVTSGQAVQIIAPTTQPAAAANPASQPANVHLFKFQPGGNVNGQIVVVGGGQVQIQGNVVVQGQMQIQIQPAGGAAVIQPIAPSGQPGQPAQAQPIPPADSTPPAAAPAGGGSTLRGIDAEYAGVKVESILLTGEKDKPGTIQFTQTAGEKRDLSIADLVRVDVQPGAGRSAVDRIPDGHKAMAVLLTDGEWLAGVITGGDKRNLRVDMLGIGELAVPLRNVRAIVSPAGRARLIQAKQGLESLERSLLSPAGQAAPAAPAEGEAAATDIVRLANGETLAGTIIEVNDHGLLVSASSGQLKVDFDVLNVAELNNPADPAVSPDSPAMAWVELSNGSRLLAGRMEWRNGALSLSRPGSTVVIKPAVESAQLLAIETVNGRWRWLDSLSPLLAEHRPFLTVKWPARFGVNVAGGPIMVAGKTYGHGIGVHSASKVIYDIKGATRFHCIGGFDAGAGPAADVAIGVYVDGERALERKSYKFADGPLTIDLPLKGAQKLELRVEFGPNGDVQARFDWADAAVIY